MVKNFMKKSIPVKIGIIVATIAALIAAFYVGCFVFGMSIFAADIFFSRKHTYKEVENYSKYIGDNAVDEYSSKWGMDESIFPEKILDSMQVDDFSFTYYNPWDTEYVGYHTVKYSQDEYKGLFEVKDKPEKYSILEMNLDKYLPKQYQLKGMDVSKRN
jgi:hypothetical protein